MKLNREMRVCFIDRPSAVLQRFGQTFSVDRELASALCAEGDEILDEVQQFGDDRGRVLCFVPLVGAEEQEMMAQEIDATQYGLSRPLLAKELEAFRVIRSQRIAAQMASRRKK